MIGKRIRELRNEKGLTLKQLGNILNLGESTMSMYENNKRSPDYDTLSKLAKYFGVTTDYLIGKTAFRNPRELFEHWSGHNNPYFESPFDFGGLLKKVRESQGISLGEVSGALEITESDVDDIENGILPLNYEWAEKYAKFLGTSVTEIFQANGMGTTLDNIPLELLHHYQKQGMSEIEMAIAYLKFRNAEFQDAMSEPVNIEEKSDDIQTLAAHHDGEEWAEEELAEIERFKEFIRSKRKQ